MIKDLIERGNASGIYLIKDVNKGITTNGLNYLSFVLQDKSGVIDAKKWDVTAEDINKSEKGKIVRIDGEVTKFKDKLQIRIAEIYEVDPEDNDLSSLLMLGSIEFNTLIEDFNYYKNSIKNDDCKVILDAVFKKYYSKFIDYPAAVRNHHEFYHGLLHHSVMMCKVAEQLSKLYDCDYDLLISGCLLHDIGKVIEFSGYVAPSYTNEGNLLGHISIGMSIIKEISDELKIISEVPLLLEHMILSHHGKLEYGSPVVPLTREALLLSMIDDLDAKMMVLDKAFSDIEEGSYTERIFALDNASYYKHKKIK